jgi:hypothetical protein
MPDGGAMPDGAAGPDGGVMPDGIEVDGAHVAEVLYRDDPFGVAYLVACL